MPLGTLIEVAMLATMAVKRRRTMSETEAAVRRQSEAVEREKLRAGYERGRNARR